MSTTPRRARLLLSQAQLTCKSTAMRLCSSQSRFRRTLQKGDADQLDFQRLTTTSHALWGDGWSSDDLLNYSSMVTRWRHSISVVARRCLPPGANVCVAAPANQISSAIRVFFRISDMGVWTNHWGSSPLQSSHIPFSPPPSHTPPFSFP